MVLMGSFMFVHLKCTYDTCTYLHLLHRAAHCHVLSRDCISSRANPFIFESSSAFKTDRCFRVVSGMTRHVETPWSKELGKEPGSVSIAASLQHRGCNHG